MAISMSSASHGTFLTWPARSPAGLAPPLCSTRCRIVRYGTPASTRIHGCFRREMRRRSIICHRPCGARLQTRSTVDRWRGYVPGELPDRDVPPALEPTPVAAAWSGRLPVSFCYPALRTERWWDISIETLKDYRRRGYAARAVRAMTRQMWQTGRWPVWGATVDDIASLAAARTLGFQEVGRLAVFSGEPPS